MRSLVLIWLLACARALGAEAPAITAQPQSRTNVAGTDASFTVTATGTEPLAYQWTLALEVIAGATASSYTATNVQVMGEPASYQVVITNASGSVTSEVAYLTVTEPGEPEPDTNYYAAVSGLPKMRLGGQGVSMMVKADKFLPLVLAKSLAACVAGVTNDAQGLAARQVLATGKTQLTNLSDAVNGTWSNTFAFKHLDGISSGSLGCWGDEYARTNQPSCCGPQGSWGIFQVPCVLINEWFVIKPGHTGLWTGTNCLIRFIGTNGQAYFASASNGIDWDGVMSMGTEPPPQYVIDLMVIGPTADMKLMLLSEAVAPEVSPAWVWPTNYMDYCASQGTVIRWMGIGTCQQAVYVIDPVGGQFPTAYAYPPSVVYATFSYQTNLNYYTVPHGGGDSGSPHFSVLGNKAVLDFNYIWSGPNRRSVEAAMMHLWTNAGKPPETCPGFREVDLSGYARLR
jgi:hypothetical protein